MEFDPAKKTLVIVESPTKANTIKKYLPKNYSVVASKGHIRDLPSDSLGVDIEDDFKPHYVITEGKETLVNDIKKKLEKSEQLLLATDEDREGESISWHLMEILKPQVPTKRMVFHEITKKAVTEALSKGRDLDIALVRAQEDRRIVDRLYGYEVSPVLWKRLSNKKLSAGRVQSVGLRFLVDRENERLAYVPSVYFDVKAILETSDKKSFEATLEEYKEKKVATSKDFDSTTGEFNGKTLLLDKKLSEEVKELCQNNPFIVENVIHKSSKYSPLPPFTTSTMQQVANRRLRLSSKETMRIAQALFENGFITYMRTDSVNLSDECIALAREQIKSDYGSEYLSSRERRFENKSKNAQEAHEAIRPAGDVFRRPSESGLKGKELALYTLIYQRTLATQMSEAIKSTTTVKIKCEDAKFTASGTSVVFAGYLKVYGSDQDEDEKESTIPSISAGDEEKLISISEKEHTTQPPARYNEASLIKKLEEKGIGRPSTYATIISTLLDRGYAIEKDRSLIPSFTGFAVNGLMNESFSDLVDYSYTSEMEDELDKIASGEGNASKYLNDFYYGKKNVKGLNSLVQAARNDHYDAKSLKFPHLSGRVELDEAINYQIKVGPYGAYLLLDKKKDDGKAIMINLPDTLCPGTLNNDDIASLVKSTLYPDQDNNSTGTQLKSSRRGQYWQRGDKTCNVPKGKKSAESYSEEEIDFYFSLPKVIAHDEEGNDIVINNGPYGGYITYKNANYKVFGPLTELTAEKALSLVSRDGASSKGVEYSAYDGKAVSIKKGRFGSYLKWGSENIALTKDEKQKSSELTQAEVEEIIKRHLERNSKVSDVNSRGLYEGKAIEVLKGRFGYYIKCGDKNYRMSKEEQEKADNLSADELVAIIKRDEERNLPLKDFGTFEGLPLRVLNGRYGAYLKWGDKNIALSTKYKKDLYLLGEDEAKELARAKQ